jgi:hypothetical protein
MPMACQELVSRIGEGDREEKKNERNLVNREGIRVKLKTI